ncbi:hypothetical protein GCM10011519_08760 [Marmoricola endophyticus]|uniref:Mce-associated membrane protein n=1 Tax=Marmoricola endophyticus TaxID=2040280 RepID=A0A917BDU6_9ACTN|nr:hypothetical protein [Marmoricola endophyticus]GGF37458.1 hypothetical protein GCM10011519_08760 [Marmoricola endophyticus]
MSILKGRLGLSLLAVLGVVLLAVGIIGFVRGHQIRSVPAAQNDALVDSASTAKVEAEVSQALTQVLSYDYTDPAPTEASAKQLLQGDARTQYDELFTELQKRAAGQKLTLTAKVRTAGVESLSDDSAKLLVFLDQTSTRATDNQSNVAAAQVAITARDVDGTWKITGLRPL